MSVVGEVRKAQIARELERLDQLLRLAGRAAELLDDGIAEQRFAAQIASIEATAVTLAEGAGELRQIDLFDDKLHGSTGCIQRTAWARTALAAIDRWR